MVDWISNMEDGGLVVGFKVAMVVAVDVWMVVVSGRRLLFDMPGRLDGGAGVAILDTCLNDQERCLNGGLTVK
jgi:hypothetical protein